MSRWEALDLAWQAKDTAWVWEYGVIYDLISPGTRVLDVGCGDGVLGGQLYKRKDCEVSGMDMSQEAVRKAKQNGVDAVVGDIEKPFEFTDDLFDYAILCNILEHLVDPMATLKESLRVSRKGVIISTPNIAVYPARIELALGRFPRVPMFGKKWYTSQHIRLCSYRDFRNVLNELNFNVRLVKGVFQPFYATPILAGRLPVPFRKLITGTLGNVENFTAKILAKQLPNLFSLSYVVMLVKNKDFSVDKIKSYEYSV
jgi:methionine biosynthesis protein MetW